MQIDLSKKIKLEEIINLIIDKTGLNPPHVSSSKILPNDELLYIKYPFEFSAICYQPTVFSSFWLNPGGLYISYQKKDGYGRTFSTTGKPYSNKERIHSWSKFNHSDFKLISIGKPDDLLKKEITEDIINEALKRFQDATK